MKLNGIILIGAAVGAYLLVKGKTSRPVDPAGPAGVPQGLTVGILVIGRGGARPLAGAGALTSTGTLYPGQTISYVINGKYQGQAQDIQVAVVGTNDATLLADAERNLFSNAVYAPAVKAVDFSVPISATATAFATQTTAPVTVPALPSGTKLHVAVRFTLKGEANRRQYFSFTDVATIGQSAFSGIGVG